MRLSNQKTSQMTFGILGAGNTGVAMAADIENRGDRALVFATPSHDRVLRKIEAQGYVDANEALVGRYYPEITEDLGYLISSTDYLVITVPSTGHDEIMALLKPYKQQLRAKTVVFITGNGVAPLAYRELELLNAFETSRAPYTSRIEEHEHGVIKIRVNGFKLRMIIAGVHKPTQKTSETLHRLFGMPLVWYDNICQVLLVGYHGLLHPLNTLRNQDAVREKRNAFFYRDLMTPAVCTEIWEAEMETAAISNALGVDQKEACHETLNGDYGYKFPNVRACANGIEELNRRRGVLPTSMKHRYITQDIAFVVVLWCSIGQALGVPTTVLDSWIDEACEINETDYRKSGRTLERYGVRAGASRNEVRAALYVQDSWSATDRRHIDTVPVRAPSGLQAVAASMPAIRIR